MRSNTKNFYPCLSIYLKIELYAVKILITEQTIIRFEYSFLDVTIRNEWK